MFFNTEEVCAVCGDLVTVYPVYSTVAKVRQRSLPAQKKCSCGWEEITTSELDSLVPDWDKIMNPGDPNEKLEE